MSANPDACIDVAQHLRRRLAAYPNMPLFTIGRDELVELAAAFEFLAAELKRLQAPPPALRKSPGPRFAERTRTGRPLCSGKGVA